MTRGAYHRFRCNDKEEEEEEEEDDDATLTKQRRGIDSPWAARLLALYTQVNVAATVAAAATALHTEAPPFDESAPRLCRPAAAQLCRARRPRLPILLLYALLVLLLCDASR